MVPFCKLIKDVPSGQMSYQMATLLPAIEVQPQGIPPGQHNSWLDVAPHLPLPASG